MRCPTNHDFTVVFCNSCCCQIHRAIGLRKCLIQSDILTASISTLAIGA